MGSQPKSKCSQNKHREVTVVEAKEKQIARTVEEALAGLPEEKKQYFLGYAEGLAAMADAMKKKAS